MESHLIIENPFVRTFKMFNLLLTIFIVYYFYKNSIKTGKFRICLSKFIPTVISALQDMCDKIDGRERRRYSSNRQKNNSNHMSDDEARRVLGVKHNASNDEVIKAFKKLMLINHPDKGGSEYIAAKVIQAKEILIKKQ